MKYSKYQKKIFKVVKNDKCNVVISAVAGSGKTTTIEHCMNIIPPKKSTISLAFNNSIVKELKERIKNKDVEITTMHSFCWKNLMRHYGYKIKLNKNKSAKYIKQILKNFKIPQKRHAYYMYVFSTMSSLMRQNIIYDIEMVESLSVKYDFTFDVVEMKMLQILMKKMDADKKEFDFTDMIYRVIKDDVRLSKYDYIFVDESQDLSTAQQMVISRIKKTNGRMIAVGDPAQAIYGFAGADNNSYKKLKNLFDNTVELPLSVNYRCGKNIVKEAQKINTQIEPFELSKPGIVRDGIVKDIKNGDWVLCRNLKPLVQLNMYFLSMHVKSFIKGIDIGTNLALMIKRTNKSSVSAVAEQIEKNIEREKAKLRKKGVRNPENTEKIDNLLQRLDIIKLLSQDMHTAKQVIDRIYSIFKEQGDGICLSTIHKSKGLENDNIFILCPELIPSQYATQPWQLEQEDNLLYVAITRAKNKLIYIRNDKFREVQKHLKQIL